MAAADAKQKKNHKKTAIDKRESMRIANQVKVCSFFIILFCYSSFGKVRASTFAHELSAEGGSNEIPPPITRML